MKVLDKLHYKEKAYNKEQYSLDVYDENLGTSKTIYDGDYKKLHKLAIKEAKKGMICSIWELKSEIKS